MRATPDVAAFMEEARRFCAFVEAAGQLPLAARVRGARRQLANLYAAACLLPNVQPSTEDAPDDTGGPQPKGCTFGDLDVYWEVFDPYEQEEPVCGQLSDDFLDIYRDLRLGFGALEYGNSLEDAIWTWRFHFDFHWGNHAVDALRALQRACERVLE